MSDTIVVELTTAEAVAVADALRQYQPYFVYETSPARFVRAVTDLRLDIESVLAKLRAADAA